MLTEAVRYSLLASATSRLSRTATTSPFFTGSPRRLSISATVPTTRAGTRAIRSVSGVTVPGAIRCRERVPPWTGETLISWEATCSADILIVPSAAWSSAFSSVGFFASVFGDADGSSRAGSVFIRPVPAKAPWMT